MKHHIYKFLYSNGPIPDNFDVQLQYLMKNLILIAKVVIIIVVY